MGNEQILSHLRRVSERVEGISFFREGGYQYTKSTVTLPQDLPSFEL